MKARPSEPGGSANAATYLFYVSLLVFSMATVMMYVGIGRLDLFDQSYFASYSLRQQNDPRLFGGGFTLALMAMTIALSCARPRAIGWLLGAYVGVFLPLFLFGYRGHFIVYMISALVIWHRKNPQCARRVAVISGCCLLLLAPAIKSARTESLTLTEALSATSILDLPMEAGGSLWPLVATLEQIHAYGEPYWYGRIFWVALEEVIPNLRLAWQPVQERSVQSPSSWISAIEAPWSFARGGGIGYSAVAEPYLGFGLAGVIVWFASLAYGLLRLDGLTPGSYKFAVGMCAFSALLWTTRNDLKNLVRPVVWSWTYVQAVRLWVGWHARRIKRAETELPR